MRELVFSIYEDRLEMMIKKEKEYFLLSLKKILNDYDINYFIKYDSVYVEITIYKTLDIHDIFFELSKHYDIRIC